MEAVGGDSGRHVIVSFPEPFPDDDVLYFLQENRIGGIILFAEHCRDPESLKGWLADFMASLPYQLIVAVDQEGGRVRRLATRFPDLEAPRHYGSGKRLHRYQDDLARVCERLREIGFNLNLVPTVDLFDQEEGHVLDSRTFSDDPEVVGQFARATIATHKAHGLLSCAKHFPGLGRSKGDPHQVLSVADLTEDQFFEVELPPFRDAIRAGVDLVMVTHLSAPKVDLAPAVVSERMISVWLKGKMGFAGPVITDDLQMAGALGAADLSNLAVRSFTAGADLLLFGRDLEATRQALDVFSERWAAGRFGSHRIADARSRVDIICRKIAAARR